MTTRQLIRVIPAATHDTDGRSFGHPEYRPGSAFGAKAQYLTGPDFLAAERLMDEVGPCAKTFSSQGLTSRLGSITDDPARRSEVDNIGHRLYVRMSGNAGTSAGAAASIAGTEFEDVMALMDALSLSVMAICVTTADAAAERASAGALTWSHPNAAHHVRQGGPGQQAFDAACRSTIDLWGGISRDLSHPMNRIKNSFSILADTIPELLTAGECLALGLPRDVSLDDAVGIGLHSQLEVVPGGMMREMERQLKESRGQ